MTDYRNSLYESYKRQRTKLHDAALETGARYDRIVLTLGGGAMALSITFIEKIAPEPRVWTIALLILAWFTLLLSVIMQLLALATSQKAVHHQIDRLDAEYQFYFGSDNVEECVRQRLPESESPYVTKLKFCNDVSMWSLVIGIIFLFLFSGSNLCAKKEIHHDRQERTETVH